MSATETTAKLIERFSFLTARPSLDHAAVNCPADQLLQVVETLKGEDGYDFLIDVTAIDHGVEAASRYEALYHLYHGTQHQYLRIAVLCTGGSSTPAVPSLCGLYAGANWHERETYDMFGITFTGHPDLRRILMWDAYPYFPLRKDFPLAGIEVELPAADVAERTGAKVKPAPMMGGPFHAGSGMPMSDAEPRAKDESWTEKQEKPTNA